MLKEITRKVVSYCDIPEDIDKGWLDDLGCDVYTEYSLSSDPKFSKTELDEWLEKTYPELIDTEFLIHIDY